MSAALSAALPSTASADPITFNLAGTDSAGTIGNTRTYTSGGITLTATAWGYTGSSNTRLAAGALGRWSPGLGVCDASEGAGCSSPSHMVDNAGPDNWVLMRFSTPVDPASVRIDSLGYDSDASYFVGNVSGAFTPSGKTYADLLANGFEARRDSTGGAGIRDVTINQTAPMVNAILFGTYLGEFSGSDIDRFKIKSVTVYSTIPEPAILLLTGAGLAGFVARRRRAA